MIGYKGHEYYTVWYNGKEYDRGYFNGLRVLGKLDDTPYLLAKNANPVTRIKQGQTFILVTNSNPAQIMQDTLTGVSGVTKFNISMDIDSSELLTYSKLLVKIGNLTEIWTDNSTLLLRVPAISNSLLEVPSSIILSGKNSVSVQADGVHVYLVVNDYRYTIFDADFHYNIFQYTTVGSPTIATYDNLWVKASNFSTSKYLKATQFPNLANASNWRIGTRVKITGGSGYGPVCGGSARYIYPALGLNYNINEFYAQLSSNGSGWDMGITPGAPFTLNTIIDVVLQYVNGQYNIGVKSPEQTTYAYGANPLTSSTKHYGNPMTSGTFNYGSMWGDRALTGEIYTKGCFIEADGVYYSNGEYYPYPYPTFDTVSQVFINASNYKINNVYLTNLGN